MADLSRVKPYTKSTMQRLASMANALRDVDANNVPGDVVEVGVWRGGNIMLARLMSPHRACWLYDTFDGMTEPDHELDVKRLVNGVQERAIDRYRRYGDRKWNAASVDEVRSYFALADVSLDNTHFVEGPVELTLDTVSPRRVAILRLDVDWHLPTRLSLEKLYPRLSPGGFLIVDDYGHWMGCKKAVDDFFGGNAPPFHDADYSCRVFHK